MRLNPHLSVSLFEWVLGLYGPRPSVRGLSLDGCGKYLSYAAHHNTKARKQAHRTVSTITCKHMCSAPHFSTLRWWRYDESHAIPKASETLDLRTAQTRRDPSSKKARAESNIPTPPQANETLAATQTASPKAESLLLPWVPRTQSL